ncbi:MAG: hypothetical protein QG620_385 [Patescibacteria group bacterium]|nr:hypothetical protein [Patescibacteria group bacterium]
MRAKFKAFWEKYEYKIILAAGFILVSAISFEAGILKGAQMRQKPIIIEKPAENVAGAAVDNSTAQSPPGAQNLPQEEKNGQNDKNAQPQNCTLVGSKNSNKYHLPTCRYAKGIKPENKVCFKDAAEAQVRGYQPDKNCIE